MKKLELICNFQTLNETLITCKKCPRLVDFRENVPEKKVHQETKYWKRPVPGFGDPDAQLLILGLAPSAQGGNRTGRIFTGDASAAFLFKTLYKQGFANQSSSLHRDDGLELKNCYLTAAVKCVPSDNKPLSTEQKNCLAYLLKELDLLKNITAVLTLGQFAFNTYLHHLLTQGAPKTSRPFFHGATYGFEHFPTLYASYHPSPQNTNTGKLTEEMFNELLINIKQNIIKTSNFND